MTVNNTIVAGNSVAGTENDIKNQSSTANGNYDLTGDSSDPGAQSVTGAALLAPLGNNGGPTQTTALMLGSPAIDTGSNALIPNGVTTDQRGDPRIVNGTVDIGAFEFNTTSTTLADNGPSPSNVGQSVSFSVTVSPNNTPPNGETVKLQDNGVDIPGATGTLTNGSVTINVTGLSAGVHSNITAVYTSDGTYAGSTSVPVSQTVLSVTLMPPPVLNSFTAPIRSLTYNVGTQMVIVTTLGATSYTAGAPIWIDSTSVPGDNGEFTVAAPGSSGDTFSYLDTNAGAGSAATTLGTVTTTSADGAGSGSLGTGQTTPTTAYVAQRSMVDSIIYTFAAPIAKPTVSIVVHAGQTGTVPTVNFNSADSTDEQKTGTTWIVTFSGAGVVGNSIADGVYDVTLTAGAFTQTDTFYRTFGDINGDNQVNSLTDVTDFKKALGASSGAAAYVAAFDVNADAQINSLVDFTQFKLRLGRSVSGFTETI